MRPMRVIPVLVVVLVAACGDGRDDDSLVLAGSVATSGSGAPAESAPDVIEEPTTTPQLTTTEVDNSTPQLGGIEITLDEIALNPDWNQEDLAAGWFATFTYVNTTGDELLLPEPGIICHRHDSKGWVVGDTTINPFDLIAPGTSVSGTIGLAVPFDESGEYLTECAEPAVAVDRYDHNGVVVEQIRFEAPEQP